MTAAAEKHTQTDAEVAAGNVFPITIPCNDQGHSDHDYRGVFVGNKPKDLTWYGYHTVIHSRTDLEFVVFGMRDSYYGGLGSEIARFTAKVAPDATRHDVEHRIFEAASERRERELQVAEDKIIRGYADEIRATLAASSIA